VTIQGKTAITLAAVGLLVILVSLPLFFRKIGKNPVYGFRIAKAFESDENWYRINQHGARGMILWGSSWRPGAASASFSRRRMS
jgi:hypothetical protein